MKPELPFIMSVQGLKKSGKTTTVEALISSLTARGYRVGGLKSTHRARLDLDRAGSDTDRLSRAGSTFLVALADKETMIVDHRPSRRDLRALSPLFPEDLELLICEGLTDPLVRLYILCLRRPGELEQALRLRKIPRDRLLALACPLAACEGVEVALPRFDPLVQEDGEALTELLLDRAGIREKGKQS